jgi:phosphate transport system protein
VEVESEAVRLLALFQPVGVDLRLLCTILKVNNDLERIADCAVNMAERACHLEPHWVVDQVAEMGQLCPVVRQVLRDSIRAYSNQDAEAASAVLGQDPMVDALYAQIIRGVIARGANSPSSLASHLDLLSAAKNLERIADHATNIAEDVIYLCTGSIVRHRPYRPSIA